MSKNKRNEVVVSEVAIWMASILTIICFVMAMVAAAIAFIAHNPSIYWLSGLCVVAIGLSWWAAATGGFNPRPRRRGGYHYGYGYDPGAIHD